MKTEDFGYFEKGCVENLCSRCRYMDYYGKLVCCEYGNKEFPKARHCMEFEDVESIET